MFNADDIRSNQSRMERTRSTHDQYWQEIASLCYPELQNFQGGQLTRSRWYRDQIGSVGTHDAYSAQALQDGVSLFESYIMPRGQRWQKLELGDEGLMAKVNVMQWMEKMELRLFSLRNHPESGFVSAVHDSATSLFSFGPQSMWVDDRWDDFGNWGGISYESEFVGDVWVERDSSGNVFRIHRKIAMTAEVALRKWGDQAPMEVKKAMSQTPPNRDNECEYIHVIEKNTRWDPQRIDVKGKPWIGCYFCPRGAEIFKVGGYHSLPRIVSAFNRPGQLTYGRSPTMMALPLIRRCMEIERDLCWSSELRLLPPLLTADNDLDILDISPFGQTEGGLDDRGNPLVRELLTNADSAGAEKLVQDARALIDKIFYRDLLQLDREYKSHIPAARIEEERAEKGILLAPLGRQEAEWLSPMTSRELSLMSERGLLDDMPGEVAEYLQSAGTLGIRYDNGLTQLQEAGKSAAFLSVAGQIGSLAQFNPDYVKSFNREYPPERVIPELGRIAGIPAAMRATDEERQAYDQKEQQDAQLQQLLAAAPALAGAAKDAAAAGQQGGGMMPQVA